MALSGIGIGLLWQDSKQEQLKQWKVRQDILEQWIVRLDHWQDSGAKRWIHQYEEEVSQGPSLQRIVALAEREGITVVASEVYEKAIGKKQKKQIGIRFTIQTTFRKALGFWVLLQEVMPYERGNIESIEGQEGLVTLTGRIGP